MTLGSDLTAEVLDSSGNYLGEIAGVESFTFSLSANRIGTWSLICALTDDDLSLLRSGTIVRAYSGGKQTHLLDGLMANTSPLLTDGKITVSGQSSLAMAQRRTYTREQLSDVQNRPPGYISTVYDAFTGARLPALGWGVTLHESNSTTTVPANSATQLYDDGIPAFRVPIANYAKNRNTLFEYLRETASQSGILFSSTAIRHLNIYAYALGTVQPGYVDGHVFEYGNKIGDLVSLNPSLPTLTVYRKYYCDGVDLSTATHWPDQTAIADMPTYAVHGGSVSVHEDGYLVFVPSDGSEIGDDEKFVTGSFANANAALALAKGEVERHEPTKFEPVFANPRQIVHPGSLIEVDAFGYAKMCIAMTCNYTLGANSADQLTMTLCDVPSFPLTGNEKLLKALGIN